jgi:hypothetical protein
VVGYISFFVNLFDIGTDVVALVRFSRLTAHQAQPSTIPPLNPVEARTGTGTIIRLQIDKQAHVPDQQTATGSVKSTTQSVPPGDRAPATRFFVRSHENGWAAAVIDMGEGGDPRRPVFLGGIARVGAEPLQTTPLTAYDVYEDLGRARHASDQLLRKWTNHAKCSASCLEWIEMEVR